jgi:MFS family permease
MLGEVVAACAGGSVIAGWAFHLGLSAPVVGLLGAIPSACQVIQLPGAILTAVLGRRRLSLGALAISRCAWVALAAIPWSDVAAGRTILVATVVLSSLFTVLGSNAWVAWMGDLVPASMHGRFFGRRTAAATGVGTLGTFVAGMLLDRSPSHTAVLVALSFVAACAGAASLALMARQQERRASTRPRRAPCELLAPLRDPLLRPLVAYQFAWNGAVGIAGCFFVPWLLGDLRLGYTWVAVHATAAAAARTLSAPLWGRRIDRVGAGSVLASCSVAVAFAPFLWVLAAPDRLWPLVIDAIVGGALSAGQSLALFGLPLRIAPRDVLPAYVGALSAAAGLATALAAAAGGTLALRLQGIGHGFGAMKALFLVSGTARLLAGALAWRLRGPAGTAGVAG